MANELKPCPFCGHLALLEPSASRKGYEANVNCTNCLAVIYSITYDTKDEAILSVVTAWNKRHSQEPRPIEEWHEDYGDVLWWQFPIVEPPYCGTPLDSDWNGYHTHWTPLNIPDVEHS